MSSTSTFKTRLKFYMIGLIIGSFFMFMIFGNRGCSWLPENRVKNEIADGAIFVGDSIWNLMLCAGVDHEDVYRFVDDDGDINFSESETRSDPRIYRFEGEKNDKDLILYFAILDTTAEVVNFEFEGKDACSTGKSNRFKKPVPIPDYHVREIIESKEIRMMDSVRISIEEFNMDSLEVFNFHKNATIDMEHSEPWLSPNPYYVMNGEIKGNKYAFVYEIGENRTRIRKIHPYWLCDC